MVFARLAELFSPSSSSLGEEHVTQTFQVAKQNGSLKGAEKTSASAEALEAEKRHPLVHVSVT